jgi:chromosomal replication initiation ATPase DnaA
MPRSIEEIITFVETVAEFAPGTICDTTQRTHEVSLWRHIVFYVARRETHLSFKRIASATKVSDHKSILYGFNRIAVGVTQRNDEIVGILQAAFPEYLSR